MNLCNASSKPMREMTVYVDVEFATEDDSAPGSDEIAVWVNRAVEASGRDAQVEISVRVVDAREMQQLNSEYRDQDRPTNVLSFPAGGIDGLPADVPRPLGDIVVCAVVVNKEAEQQDKSVANHWAHMMIHGTLHLLGFDHESDSDAVAMEGLETRILSDYGIASPYGESPQET